jgi:hypothetical protein
MSKHLQAIVTVLALVNPVVSGAMFAQIEVNCARGKQMADATNLSVAVLVILALAALVGTRLLDLFGVSLDAFMVAGGGVLAWMSFSMLSGPGSSARPPAAPANSGATARSRSLLLGPLVKGIRVIDTVASCLPWPGPMQSQHSSKGWSSLNPARRSNVIAKNYVLPCLRLRPISFGAKLRARVTLEARDPSHQAG